MAVKASAGARGRAGRGRSNCTLTEADADRIDSRLDEHYRRERLEQDYG